MNRRTTQDSAQDPVRESARISTSDHAATSTWTTAQQALPERHTTLLQNTAAAVAVVTLGAVFAALAVWVIAVPVADLTLIAGGLTVSPTAVALVSLGSGCAAGISYLIMRRFRGGTKMWTVVGCAAVALSMAGPPTSGAAGAALVALELMHLAVGATVIVGLRSFVPRLTNRPADSNSASADSTPTTAQSE